MPSSVAMDRIRICSSSLVIYISLYVFHCNIHDIARTKCRLRWRSKLDCERRLRPSSVTGGADDLPPAAADAAADDGMDDTEDGKL